MQLSIGWLFPKLMSIYGDRGNILCLKRRAELRGIKILIIEITESTPKIVIETVDLFFGGGSQDKEQEIILSHYSKGLGMNICKKLEKGTPALLICGSMQLFGKSFQAQGGQIKDGVGFFDCTTRFPDSRDVPTRLVGDLVVKMTAKKLLSEIPTSPLVIGFENHRYHTYLENSEPFGQVIKGYGNNGKDGHEGIFCKNALGTYSHGPLLPKNPFLADWLLKTAIEVKYQKKIDLSPLDDHLANSSRHTLFKRWHI